MDRERINIYFDKKYAALIYAVMLFGSVYLFLLLWSVGPALFLEILGTVLCLFFLLISSFGFFTLISKRFKYYGPGTSQYKNQPSDPVAYLIFPDRIEARVNPDKVIYYKDIISLSANPNCFIDDWGESDEYFFFLEIRDRKGQRMLLSGEKFEFLNQFNQSMGCGIKNYLSAREIDKQYGRLKVILCSLLFQASPLRVALWSASR